MTIKPMVNASILSLSYAMGILQIQTTTPKDKNIIHKKWIPILTEGDRIAQSMSQLSPFSAVETTTVRIKNYTCHIDSIINVFKLRAKYKFCSMETMHSTPKETHRFKRKNVNKTKNPLIEWIHKLASQKGSQSLIW